jgi:hypothetical protein
MSASSELIARRKLLVLEMQIQRQLIAVASVPMIAGKPVYARSVTMRFILNRPHLCLWALGEFIPFLVSKFSGSKGKRFARAFHADQDM